MAVIAGDSAEDHAASSSSSRKMKFLCSFGGKILPRPSDGALRYVGGHTRIISVRRGSSFHELKSKMSDVFGGAAVLKYQLPDEDLDALVTVSSPEDLDDMMEEYDKLAEISPDGSVKLRVFLFSPSELDSQTLNLDPDINDCENKYVDAVNGIADIRLSEFLSAQTSDEAPEAPGELLACNFGGPSDAISSPIIAEAGTVASTGFQDPFELVYPPILPSDPVIARVESKSIPEEPPSSGLASISLDYLESLQVGFKGIKNLEQRDRIQYLNSHQFTAPIPQNSHVQDIESGSDQFFDVFASQKAGKTDQTSLTVDPEAPYSYFDEIIRQHQPPVGPPQFLLKQDLLVNDPLSVSIPTATKETGQRSEVNLLLSEGSSGPDPWKAVVKPDTEVGDLLDGISVDHESAVDSAHEVNRIHLSQQGDQDHEGQKAISQRSSANHLAAIQSSKVNFQKSIPPTSYLDDKTLPLEKSNLGFGVLDDQGVRLQIIKNSDLEELRELGTGAFGTVYHGKWRGTDVAIKRINDRCFSGKPSEQERSRVDFWNEACKLADLHHPNVVAFYGVVIDGPGGSMATVTEFMVNGSLWQALRENDKSLDQWKRRLIAMDAAFGMEYLHGKNIVHFDLKSDNLLVNLGDPNRPICKVGDLGLSKVKRQTLISGGVRGTLPWMAPELLNGRTTLVSEKVDVFSFGIVMWELLTGEEPYADLHHGAIIGGIVSDTLRPTVPESCDPEWRALMVACWSTDPVDRPSFTEIAGQLRSMAQQSPGSHVITA